MSHYQTLDVPRDATSEDIKRAYRRKASKAHPDKGGSDEQMAALNRAMAVLEDPARREQYDRTGEDGEKPSIEARARQSMFSMFKQALEVTDANLVAVVSLAIGSKKTEMLRERHKAQAKRERLVRRRGKVKAFDGVENIAHTIIDQEVSACNAALEQIGEIEQVMDQCTRMLKAYTDETERDDLAPTYSTLFSRTTVIAE